MDKRTCASGNVGSHFDVSVGGLLPPWAQALVEMGFAFARGVEALSQSNATLAVCLPRIEFAALFTALGVIGWRIGKADPKEGLERLRAMLGTWISFEVGGAFKVGRLEHVPEDEKGPVRILESKGKKPPNFDDMSLEERKKYTPPKSCGVWHLVEPRWWSTIKPVGREFNEARGARAGQIKQVAVTARNTGAVERLLGLGAEHWLLTSQERPVCIFGCKSRLDAELKEDIPLADNSEKNKMSALLRPAGCQEYAASSHVRIETCAKIGSVASESVCIIEAGRSLEDNLRGSSENNRIILFGRHAPSYEQIAQAVQNAFYCRKAEFVIDSVNTPIQIKFVSFIHK
jgi:hypothetical protein